MILGIEISCLNKSMFLYSRTGTFFSRASQKGCTSRLLYHIRKSRNVFMLFSLQTHWQYWYSSSEMLQEMSRRLRGEEEKKNLACLTNPSTRKERNLSSEGIRML